MSNEIGLFFEQRYENVLWMPLFERSRITIKLFSSTPHIHRTRMLCCKKKKKKKDRKKFLFFLDSWKRRCFSPHPSLLTDILDGNKRAKSSLCITSTHDFRDYGAVPLNGRGNIRSCRQTSSVSCVVASLAT